MTLSGHLGYRDGLLKQYRRYALNFQGYAFHGQNGPMPVRRHAREHLPPLHEAFYTACLDAGFPPDPDMNAPDSSGVGCWPKNYIDGLRVSTAMAYLQPARHRLHFTIRPRALVRRILFDGRRAVGVEVESGGRSL